MSKTAKIEISMETITVDEEMCIHEDGAAKEMTPEETLEYFREWFEEGYAADVFEFLISKGAKFSFRLAERN